MVDLMYLLQIKSWPSDSAILACSDRGGPIDRVRASRAEGRGFKFRPSQTNDLQN